MRKGLVSINKFNTLAVHTLLYALLSGLDASVWAEDEWFELNESFIRAFKGESLSNLELIKKVGELVEVLSLDEEFRESAKHLIEQLSYWETRLCTADRQMKSVSLQGGV